MTRAQAPPLAAVVDGQRGRERATLVAGGQLFELVPYPGSKHAALSFRETGIHGWKTILDFFDRTLKGDAPL